MKLYETLVNDWSNVTLSDFCRLPVKRTGDIAEIIVAYYKFDKTKPIRLLGFTTSSEKSDFDIQEEAYLYFRGLNQELQKL